MMNTLEKRMQGITTIASQVVQEWRLKHRWELHRRHASEQAREILRIIIRSWREAADTRQARYAGRVLHHRRPRWSATSQGRISRMDPRLDTNGIEIGCFRPVGLHGTFISMITNSFRLVQHDVIVRRMRGRHALDTALHAQRLAYSQPEARAHSDCVTHILRNGALWERCRDPG